MPHLSLSQVKMQSLYLAHPFRLVLLFALIQLLRRVSPVIFDIFHASTFSHLRGSLGATDDRLLSRCKLTFGFHNQMAGGQETSLKTPSFFPNNGLCVHVAAREELGWQLFHQIKCSFNPRFAFCGALLGSIFS